MVRIVPASAGAINYRFRSSCGSRRRRVSVMIRMPRIVVMFQTVVITTLVACTPIVMGEPAGPSHADSSAQVYDAAMVIAWNERVLAIAEAEDHFLTVKGVRTAAMMHVAMHDALNSIHSK